MQVRFLDWLLLLVELMNAITLVEAGWWELPPTPTSRA